LEYAAGEAAIEAIQAQEDLLKQSATVLKVPPEKLPSVAERFFEEWKQLKKENERLRGEIVDLTLGRLKGQAEEISGVKVIAAVLPDAGQKELRNISSRLVEEGYATMNISGSNATVVYEVPAQLSDRLNANEWLQHVSQKYGGKGGGTATLAQGGGVNIELVNEACEEGLRYVKEKLRKK
jgi:alanyl-tRNA synthetase